MTTAAEGRKLAEKYRQLKLRQDVLPHVLAGKEGTGTMEQVRQNIRKAKALALVENRALRAERSLEVWERKLRLAQTKVAALRKKVAYYRKKRKA